MAEAVTIQALEQDRLPAARDGLYAAFTYRQVRNTLNELRAYRQFIRNPKVHVYDEVRDPLNWGRTLNKAQVQLRLRLWVDVAINRRGEVQCRIEAPTHHYDGPLNHKGLKSRKWDDDYYWKLCRDQQRLRAIVNQRVRHYQFETEEVRRRFGHLLADRSGD